MKIVLSNGSPTDIEVLSAYSDAVLARIAPSNSATTIYNQDCLRIRRGTEILEFRPVIPPDRYIDARVFSVRISALFTQSNELKITPLDSRVGTDVTISLPRGCAAEPTTGP
jgi:hypothetical protein